MDEATQTILAAINRLESQQKKPDSRIWQVLMAVIGGVLTIVGVLVSSSLEGARQEDARRIATQAEVRRERKAVLEHDIKEMQATRESVIFDTDEATFPLENTLKALERLDQAPQADQKETSKALETYHTDLTVQLLHWRKVRIHEKFKLQGSFGQFLGDDYDKHVGKPLQQFLNLTLDSVSKRKDGVTGPAAAAIRRDLDLMKEENSRITILMSKEIEAKTDDLKKLRLAPSD